MTIKIRPDNADGPRKRASSNMVHGTNATHRSHGLGFLKKAVLAVVMAVTGFLASVVMSPTAANAATVWPSHSSYTHNYHYSYSELRSNIYPSGGVTANMYNDTTVYMRCYADSTWYNGNYWTNRWFYVTTSWNQSGWVTSSFVYNQASVSRC